MYSKFIIVISVVLNIYLATTPSLVSANYDSQNDVCPRMCTCDMLQGRKRADCSHENLISTYTDVPTSVEILDLSINKISAIENADFEDYTNLIRLFLSENSIDSIAFNAFANLRNLEMLDLSHNRLEQLHENLFEHNEKLTDLNLSNNNFMALQNKPFLNSPSIMYLDLNNCKIPQLYENTFLYLPSLRSLDLSKNVMITLSTDPFIFLKKLRTIDLNENRWQCDSASVRATVNWMKRRLASIRIENCFINPYKHKPQFEKMELDPNYQQGKDNRQDIAIEQVWGPTTREDYWSSLKEKICAYNDSHDPENRRTCEDFIECQKRFGELYYAYMEAMEAKIDNRPYNHRLAATILLCGVFIGAVFGSFTTYSFVYLIQKCRKSKKTRNSSSSKTLRELRREFRERNNFEHTRLTESPVSHRANSNLSSQEQCQIYRNHEHTRQFLVNLFSKRQPRFVRNNSQIANLQNRYLPPIPIRSHPCPSSPSPAPTSASFTWEPVRQNRENQELEQMLDRRAESRESAWNNYYGADELQRSVTPSPMYESVTPIYVATASLSATRETPPPPYVDCAPKVNHGV